MHEDARANSAAHWHAASADGDREKLRDEANMVSAIRRFFTIFSPSNDTQGQSYEIACAADVRSAKIDSIISTLDDFGVVKLRNCFDIEIIGQLASAADDVYAERDKMASMNRIPPDMESFYKRRTIQLYHLNVRGRSAVEILNLPIFFTISRNLLNREPKIDSNSFIRDMQPGVNAKNLPFHQDQTILGSSLVNIWIPLTPCGLTAPGLEVVVAKERCQLRVSPKPNADTAVDRASIDSHLVMETYRTSLWAPQFEPGDALLFTGLTVHRTHIRPGMLHRRLSAEMRFT